jgi:outer membrane protein OmpA-like peptidoglycan-associated protein
MKYIAFLILLNCTIFSLSQPVLKGEWKGVLKSSHQELDKADVIFLTFSGKLDKIEGMSRIEILNTEDYAIKTLNGSFKDNTFTLSEEYLKSSTHSRETPKCKLIYEMTYVDSTGYLKGTFRSSDCRNKIGEIILFRSNEEFNIEEKFTASHYWIQRFIRDYKKGYPAPEIREEERANFEFQPIYFDHDKSEIRPEHFEYLNKMARILDGIHDLRVEVIGHTDAVGTDEYNIGLSKRRAKAIKDYFKTQGIEPDKLEIDFKGERQPVDSNNTSDGKQRNRRVDFKFV